MGYMDCHRKHLIVDAISPHKSNEESLLSLFSIFFISLFSS